MWWMSVAMAGTVAVSAYDDANFLDTRTGAVQVYEADLLSCWGDPFPCIQAPAGMTFNEQDYLYYYYNDGGNEQFFESEPFDYEFVHDVSYMMTFVVPSSAIVWDPQLDHFVVFSIGGGGYSAAGSLVVDFPWPAIGGAWDASVDGFLLLGPNWELFRVVNYGPPVSAGFVDPSMFSLFIAGGYTVYGMAYDVDLRILWLVTSRGGFYGLDPETFDLVAWYPPSDTAVHGGASPYTDATPAQTPELLVTGVCPGPVLVTAVDMTPGGQVKVVSGTRAGSRTAPGGPCAGATVDLANPVLRGELTANRLGLASVRMEATQAMCDRWQLQALDVSTCTTTSVRPMP